MEEYNDFYDNDTSKIASDLMDLKETARINKIIAGLVMNDNNPIELTNIYTGVLEDDNVAYILTKLSQNSILMKHFPEFYIKNQYEENIFNCQQNSSYHKFGVFKHILSTIENVGNPQIPIGDEQKKILKWTMLLHDLGKPFVKIIKEDKTDSFAGHDDKSVELAKEILDRFDFTAKEKKIILTLIKYHDRYLNEGEMTYDNMKFLASELNDDKDLFYMLINVKDSDAKAKSVDVYNKYKLTQNKYFEFINTYFSGTLETSTGIINSNIGENGNNNLEVVNEDNKELTILELDNLIEDVINRRRIVALYQPIIDISKKVVHGYETFTKIVYDKKIDIIEFLNRTKDSGRYDKLQQIMLINGIDCFENIKDKESKLIFVNSDLISYDKYINKPRLYDMMSRNKIVIAFHNYEKKDFTEMQSIIDSIHKNKGLVALDNFGVGSLTIDDINLLDIDYIIPDMSLLHDIINDSEKQKYMSELITYAISKESEVLVVGIEDKETLDIIRSLGIRFVQGYYFAYPDDKIEKINEKITKLLSNISEDNIK